MEGLKNQEIQSSHASDHNEYLPSSGQ